LDVIPAAGPVGTVKKPSVLCEALFKPLWESAWWADFHQRRQFPQASLSFVSFVLAPLSFLGADPPHFRQKMSRQDRLAATIPNSVDPQHPPLSLLQRIYTVFVSVNWNG